MWSQCACDSSTVALPVPLPNPSANNERPKLRAPVPQSIMMISPSFNRTDTHDVLPP
jgi:hypothetical protein